MAGTATELWCFDVLDREDGRCRSRRRLRFGPPSSGAATAAETSSPKSAARQARSASAAPLAVDTTDNRDGFQTAAFIECVPKRRGKSRARTGFSSVSLALRF